MFLKCLLLVELKMDTVDEHKTAKTADQIRTLKSAYKFFFNDPEYRRDYKGTKVIYPFYETLPTIEKFEADATDICIAAFPKAGTTFISAVVQMILDGADPKSLTDGPFLGRKIPFFEYKSPLMEDGQRPVDLIQSSPPPRVFFTHLGYDALPESIKKRAKIIYMARNPKDGIISQFKFLLASPVMGFDGTLDDMAQAFFDDTCIYAPFYDHVAGYWKNHWNNPNMFFTTFERMKKDIRSVVRELAAFLEKDLTEEQIDQIAHHCSFEIMKQNKNVNRSEMASIGFSDPAISNFMRAGSVGNWKEHFSPEINQKVDDWIIREEDRLKESLAGFKFEFE